MQIYVLRLNNNRYYVGSSANPQERIEQHIQGKGSHFTLVNPVIEVVDTFAAKSPFDEDNITKQYMAQYGIDNVRGGSYTQLEFSTVEKEFLARELLTLQDKCYFCSKIGHYIKNCPERKAGDTTGVVTSAADNKVPVKAKAKNRSKDKIICHRCSRTGHSAKRCNAKTDVTGAPLEAKKLLCTRCGRNNHLITNCYANTSLDGAPLVEEK